MAPAQHINQHVLAFLVRVEETGQKPLQADVSCCTVENLSNLSNRHSLLAYLIECVSYLLRRPRRI